jgi:hypothetical protein
VGDFVPDQTRPFAIEDGADVAAGVLNHPDFTGA